MEPRVNYALVGLFVLVLTSVFLVTTLWLVGVGPTADYRTYAVYPPESVAGITAESLVKFQGVEVGKVRKADIEAGEGEQPRVRLLIDVRREFLISANTTARLATQGITGLLYFIELRSGEGASQPLEPVPGAPYPVIQSELSDLARLQRTGWELLAEARGAGMELRQTLATLRALVGDDEQSRIHSAVGDANTAAAGLAQASATLNDYLERFGPAMDDLTRAIATLPGLSERAGVTLEAAAAAASSVSEAARRLEKLTSEAAPVMKTLSRDGLPELVALLNDLRGLSGRLDRLAEDLGRDPNLLLQGRPRRPGPGER